MCYNVLSTIIITIIIYYNHHLGFVIFCNQVSQGELSLIMFYQLVFRLNDLAHGGVLNNLQYFKASWITIFDVSNIGLGLVCIGSRPRFKASKS